jgi:hypothetical protein
MALRDYYRCQQCDAKVVYGPDRSDEDWEPFLLCRACLAKLQADNKALLDVLEAARCIKHWHDNEKIAGMVVSAEHVRKLWKAIGKYDAEHSEPQ